MNWRALLQTAPTRVSYPWAGGRHLVVQVRRVEIVGRLPREPGWYDFDVGHTAQLVGPGASDPDALRFVARGYLVGDHVVSRQLAERGFCPKCALFSGRTCHRCGAAGVPIERVHLSDALPLFTLVSAGRIEEGGPLIFRQEELGSGVEDEVRTAFETRGTLDDIKGVPFDLRLAFDLHSRHRDEVEARRRAAELRRAVGVAAGRRALAREDYETAAKEALRVGGAQLLGVRKSPVAGEWFVRFTVDGRPIEAVADQDLRIVDAGICLVAHGDDEYEEGTKGDRWFTLESLPDVVREAVRRGLLVVLRR